MDETTLNEIEKDINNKNVVEDRIRNLANSKKEAEDKLQAEAKGRAEAEAKLASLEKETSFLNSFTDINTKFPTASEYKDKIKEKVMTSGYSVEDATISILHAEGKLNATQAPRENVAGGSAPNQITNQPTKTVKDMSSNERWDALREAERRGDIGLS